MNAHEYASIFPMLPEVELQQLADNIAQNGLLNPITTLDGLILDGRNRYAACKLAGIKPGFTEFIGDDALAFVFAQNFTRRQLSESQKGMIGARYATLEHGANRHILETPTGVSRTISSAATRVGVGERTIDRAKAVISHGVPELAAAVEDGSATLYSAAVVAKLPHDEQRTAVAAGPDAIKAAAKAVTQSKESEKQSQNMNTEGMTTTATRYPAYIPPFSQESIERGEQAAKDTEKLWLLKSTWKKATKKDRAAFMAWVPSQQ